MAKQTKKLDEINHLELWNAVEQTDPSKTKKAKIGALNLTAINATSQIKRATEFFGMYGSSWGLKNINYEYMDIDKTRLAIVRAMFYYPTGEFEISTSIKVYYMTNGANGYLKIDDDFMKKAETDLTTKSLSKLGFNADVFMGLYDDNRYINEMKEEFKNEKPQPKKSQQKAPQPQNSGQKPSTNPEPTPKRMTAKILDKIKKSDNLELIKESLTFYVLTDAEKKTIQSRIDKLTEVIPKQPAKKQPAKKQPAKKQLAKKQTTKKKLTPSLHKKMLKSDNLDSLRKANDVYDMEMGHWNQIKVRIFELEKIEKNGKK